MMPKRRVLVIAGSDSSGGAGLEADQKVIAAHGCYAMTATAALTAQNTQGVKDVHVIPTPFVREQIDACIEDIGADVIKTGMLASKETIISVADAFRRHDVKVSVVDPVMVSTSGAQLLPQDAVQCLREVLLPLTTILTPNLPEARLLVSDAGETVPEIKTVDDLVALAKSVQRQGPRFVLLKGGHLPLSKGKLVSDEAAENHVVVDVLHGDNQTLVLETEYISSKNTHGTGCSLASAIACNLANGLDARSAVREAKYYVEAGIKSTPSIGKGSGPINHFHSTYTLPFTPGRFVDYLLSRPDVTSLWHRHTHNPFTSAIAHGTLPISKFKHFLAQDYLYLVHFARTAALAAYKADTIEDIGTSAAMVGLVQEEMKMHLEYCKSFGLAKEEIEVAEEDQACIAYSRYILDVAHKHTPFTQHLSLVPCILGYHVIAARLLAASTTRDAAQGNKYHAWLEQYANSDYVASAEKARDSVEKGAVDLSPKSLEVAVDVFKKCIKLEIGFWDMGMRGPALSPGGKSE